MRTPALPTTSPFARSILLLGLLAPAARPAQEATTGPDVTAAELEAHVRALADDAMEGRATGTEGERRAARYLAGELEAAGVRPAGDGGTYLQRVPLARTRVTAGPRLLFRDADGEEREVAHGADYDVPVVAGAAGALRVVVARSEDGVPAPDAEVALFLDAGWTRARRWLESAGAAEGAGFGAVLVQGRDEARAPHAFRAEGRLRLADEVEVEEAGARAPWLRVHGEALAGLRAGEVAALELTLTVERETVDAFNVVGLIPGAGAEGEALVLSAHYDHLGTLPEAPEGEDATFNGADDDASGCAAVLELAEAWAGREPPARSIVLLLATGEEHGLLGTRHYLDHPVAALEDTVCNLNFEMVGRPDAKVGGSGVMWLTGFERSNLGPASDELGLPVVPDPRPDQRFFQRSDNYAFAVRGVVAQTLSSYDLHADYHTVRDEADALDYAHMETVVRAADALVAAIARGELDPAWLPGGAPVSR